LHRRHGPIGGFIGTKLAVAGGCVLSAMVRGTTLDALNTEGWRRQLGDTLLQPPALASNDDASLGMQDLVIVAVKGQGLASVATQITPLIGPDTL
jgi:2-dehydropantoate 2-reductase